MSKGRFKGICGAPGVAMGRAFIYRLSELNTVVRSAGSPEAELNRYRAAVERAEAELDQLLARADKEGAEILTAHRLMLGDPDLYAMVEGAIAEGHGAEEALEGAVDQFAAMLEAVEDEYLRERAADVRDVGRRLMAALTGAKIGLTLTYPCVVVARDLAPTDTIGVDRRYLLGIVTEQGGPTSHTCIVARSWGIPAVVAAAGILEAATDGATVALDGTAGEVIFAPSPAEASAFEDRVRAAAEQALRDRAEAGEPAVTPDGHRIELAGNAGSPADVVAAVERGAEGIGLLRSEFLFMGRDAAPSEDEQYRAYSEALKAAHGHRVIIRTLDVGGDKDIPYLALPKEENPFLGVRALRLCVRRPALFQSQLRALLRAGVHGKLAIMFPMVAGLEDLRQARAALAEAEASLAAEGVAYASSYEMGIMIEIPSAALVAGHLAREADFFSIGTNDLTQYTLAMDRGNPELTGSYQPHHPAVLRLIDLIVQAAHGAGKWVGVCGEMAGQPAGALLLLGLGIDELSMAGPSVPAIRRLVRATALAEAKAVAGRALACGTPAEVLHLVAPLLTIAM